ncbi:lipid-A-disaccharide synthase [Trichormus variabilis ATCC 29413]|uniref:Lipid-A-disaccharide synthase n=2 Tax=Anabaena variabilis TaxID=264691 RepID=Q3MH12_TRIV2|nr:MULTISPECIES: lipid-A-disaccharide synthase [Nostocaceae]ABA19724.1 lipid-A-disaccharide synthase [Trichormus variabilis ATCC 29413]MBC1214747.1 lipid-A-disaccharide synthase [Trichormus variabilis ARAD]MBC1258488.1 lipid-A-disaccharide synthase [Trichormus variabilis V5]MBC1267395.1 lipid-A-disaccharide synthase [Trichormus variabilis FSR]MBC1303083.1 lipid-A-disaccharide synthase [Trichormus variabilis N2B]
MRIFISTGEVSGDLQGALLIAALKRQAVAMGMELEIVALGGDKMAAAGATILGNTSGIGSMGIFESLPYVLPTLIVQRRAIAYLKQNPPDLVVLIDYMGPNLGVGTYMQNHLPNVPVVYYIAPQEWVWSMSLRNTSRIVGFTDKLLAIFPEEARYFSNNGANVTWVGHPLLDRMQDVPSREEARANLGITPEQKAIALLPASRRQELKYLLPIIFQSAQTIQAKLPEAHFWIPLSLEVYRQPIEAAIKAYGLQATVVSGQQKEVFAAADIAITKSGTVNLELALLNVPQVVVYRLHPVTVWIARKILKGSIPFASPPNLVVMKPIVPELLQEQATPENITQAAMELLLNCERRQQTLADYHEMRQCLGELGVCDRAAQEILQML